MAYVDGNLMVNEENVTLMLSDLYTLDGAEVDAVISKLTHGTDYTIIWQELTNYESYKNADLNDAPWTNLNDSDTHQYNVNVKQGAAYRAMITVKDTAPVQGSFTEVLQADADDATSGSKIYYTNILVPTLGQSTLSYNITSSVQNQENSEGIVEGETATVHVYINGATETTPISSLTVSITKQGETKPVYTDTRSTPSTATPPLTGRPRKATPATTPSRSRLCPATAMSLRPSRVPSLSATIPTRSTFPT